MTTTEGLKRRSILSSTDTMLAGNLQLEEIPQPLDPIEVDNCVRQGLQRAVLAYPPTVRWQT